MANETSSSPLESRTRVRRLSVAGGGLAIRRSETIIDGNDARLGAAILDYVSGYGRPRHTPLW